MTPDELRTSARERIEKDLFYGMTRFDESEMIAAAAFYREQELTCSTPESKKAPLSVHESESGGGVHKRSGDVRHLVEHALREMTAC